jgi:peptide/nickel transport system substrate-binding protein
LNPGNVGGAACIYTNLAYEGDPEVAGWLKNADFRRALSLAIDRGQINEAFFLGLGTPSSMAVDDILPHNPGPEWRTRWSTYEPKQANELLDGLGLDKKDPEGYRLRTDGKDRLQVEILTWSAQFLDFTGMAEMVREMWKRVGIFADVKEVERSLGVTRREANETQFHLSEDAGSDVMWTNPPLPVTTSTNLGIPFARWYSSAGRQGTKPEDPELLRAYELFRSAGGLKEAERNRVAQDIWRIVIEQQYSIGLVGLAPGAYGLHIAKTTMGNVPARQSLVRPARIPGGSHPPTFFFKS